MAEQPGRSRLQPGVSMKIRIQKCEMWPLPANLHLGQHWHQNQTPMILSERRCSSCSVPGFVKLASVGKTHGVKWQVNTMYAPLKSTDWHSPLGSSLPHPSSPRLNGMSNHKSLHRCSVLGLTSLLGEAMEVTASVAIASSRTGNV